MNEITELAQSFDYTKLDVSTADFLKAKESNMRDIFGKAYTDLGQQLKEAQDELSKCGYGCFEEWYTSLGYKKVTVYNMINRYNLIVQNLNEQAKIEELPVSLTYEIAKPSSPPEAVQAVLDGDIKTHKEYKELERRLKQANQDKAGAERRVKEAEAIHALAVKHLSQQGDKYQEQIAALKKSKTADRPETLAKIKELEKQANIAKKEADDLRKQQEQLKTKAGQSDELKRQLDKAQEELHTVTREQLLNKDRYVIHDTLSTFAQNTGKQLKKIELEVIKYPGDPEIRKDVQATIDILRNAVAEMEQWTEAPKQRKGKVVIDGDISDTA